MSYSQLSQDAFVLNLFDKQPGFYLEVGCNYGTPASYSNCLLLEENGWRGIGLDILGIEEFNNHRKGRGIAADLSKENIEDILDEDSAPLIIDYLSFDIDEAQRIALEKMSLTKYKFKLVHFEHNLYVNHPPYIGIKEYAYNRFTDAGYIRFIDNLLDDNGAAVEDWYIYPEYVDTAKIKFLANINHRQILKEYGII